MKADPQWKDVQFDPRTGALMATHVGHNKSSEKETKVLGNFTGKQLELECLKEVFRMGGHKMLLLGENARLPNGNEATALDAILDGVKMDIRSIIENNKNTIRNGISNKHQQLKRYKKATGEEHNSLCLYFHDPIIFNLEDVKKQHQSYIDYCNKNNWTVRVTTLYCVVKGAKDIYIIK